MSSTGIWGPPPPGVDLNSTQTANIIASVTIVMIIGLSAVILRVFARLSRNGPGLGVDDYCILGASALSIGNAACCLASIRWGGGKHLWVVTAHEFTKLYQTTFAFVIVYINSVTLTKASILLYYRRLFGAGIVWWIVFGLTIAHGAEVTITWLAGCRPISFFWQQYIDPHAVGKCIDAPLFWFINGIIGMLIDIAVLLVPIPSVYGLQMAFKKKMFVCGILLLGSFVCVASIVRIIMMDRLVKAQDVTWAMCEVFIWSCAEPYVGILCACLPTFAPLVRRWFKDGRSPYSKTPKLPRPGKGSDLSGQKWKRIDAKGSSPSSEKDVELATTSLRTGSSQNESYGKRAHEITVTQDIRWDSTSRLSAD